MCLVFRKSACLFGQVKTKMYLPESPFFKKSLAGASGLVLMSVPAQTPCWPCLSLQIYTFIYIQPCNQVSVNHIALLMRSVNIAITNTRIENVSVCATITKHATKKLNVCNSSLVRGTNYMIKGMKPVLASTPSAQ